MQQNSAENVGADEKLDVGEQQKSILDANSFPLKINKVKSIIMGLEEK